MNPIEEEEFTADLSVIYHRGGLGAVYEAGRVDGRNATGGDCPDCEGRGTIQGADRMLLCSRCDATGEER